MRPVPFSKTWLARKAVSIEPEADMDAWIAATLATHEAYLEMVRERGLMKSAAPLKCHPGTKLLV